MLFRSNVSRIRNLPEATEDTEPVTFGQLKAYQESASAIDFSDAVDGSIPVYNEQSGKFVADQETTKLTITDGGNF